MCVYEGEGQGKYEVYRQCMEQNNSMGEKEDA